MKEVAKKIALSIQIGKQHMERLDELNQIDAATNFILQQSGLSSRRGTPVEQIGVVFAFTQEIRKKFRVPEFYTKGQITSKKTGQTLMELSQVSYDSPTEFSISSQIIRIPKSRIESRQAKVLFREMVQGFYVPYAGEEALQRCRTKMEIATQDSPELKVPIYTYNGQLAYST